MPKKILYLITLVFFFSIVNGIPEQSQPDETEKSCDPLPYQHQDFKTIVMSDAYIDKSLLIKNVISHIRGAVLITRPRRWGKTIAISMLRCYFEMPLTTLGEKLLYNENRKLFEGGEVTSEGIV